MRSSSAIPHLRALLFAGAVALGAPAGSARAQAPLLDVTHVAEQLGFVLLEPAEGRRMTLGDAVTGAATRPELLHRIGVKGMHKGARVVVARVAVDHVLVEVDELAPAPTRVSVKLSVGADGVVRLP